MNVYKLMKKVPFAYKITIAYIILGALWILFSDGLLYSLTSDAARYQTLSTYKGWFYVLVTGFLLFVFIKKEIRNRNILYNQLLEAKKKAEESDKLKSAFLSNISHYIRTPMNGILGFIDLIENKNTSPEKHQIFLKYINDKSELLLQTLNSIIEISKIQEGQYRVDKSEFKLAELVLTVQSAAEVEINQKTSLTFKAPDIINNHTTIFTDKKIITQIISNLISNAIHFTQKGEISFDFKIDNEITFFVKDSGPGVSEEIRKSLFKDYLYGSALSFTSGEGAGIGLYLSQKLTQLIDGRLWLESTGPQGSIFCLSIPNIRINSS